ncbi:unnamed protein product [Rhodiola kirilowii]
MDAEMEPTPLTKHKRDPAWKHCQMFKTGDKVQLKCNYCGKLFKGGGIHRMKEHLAGQRTNASTCPCAPIEVSHLMQQSLGGESSKRKRRKGPKDEVNAANGNNGFNDEFGNGYDVANATDNMQMLQVPITFESETSPGFLGDRAEISVERIGDKSRRGGSFGSPVFETPAINYNHVGYLTGPKRSISQVNIAIGKFFYDAGLPLSAVNSVYFQQMIDVIASQGLGVVAPSYNDLRGWILKSSLDQVKSEGNKLMGMLGSTGCSILLDQLSTSHGATFINVFLYTPERTIFLKGVDISEILPSPETLCEVIKGVVEEVGVENVVQVVSNGDELYAAAGKLLSEVYPNILWNTCAARCIEFILDEFGKLDGINTVLEQAKSITRLIYNNSVVLNLMRRHTGGRDLVVTGRSCIETNFASLKRLVDLKPNLQSMFTSQEWMQLTYCKSSVGLEILDLVTNEQFWLTCSQVTSLTDPLLRLLRIVSSEERPPMAYVHAGIYRAKETIKKQCGDKEDYSLYWSIIDHCWGSQWQNPLLAAGFYLNPKFFYSLTGDIHSDIRSKMYDCIEKLVGDIKIQDQIMKELMSYQNAVGDFGRQMAIRARDSTLPAVWWSRFGGGCPNLERLALRILSQTCSLTGCRRSVVPFDRLQSTLNSIEHQRITDLVYVTYNLRLGQPGEKSQDPVSSDYFRLVHEWVSPSEAGLDGNQCTVPDWVSVGSPPGDSYYSDLATDDFADLGEGFDNSEIFSRTTMDSKDDVGNLIGQ